MSNEEKIVLINEAMTNYLQSSFSKAGIPMIKLDIREIENRVNTFSIEALFTDRNNPPLIEVKVKEHDGKFELLSTSGSIEIENNTKGIEDMFQILTTSIFSKIAERASAWKAQTSGRHLDSRSLKKLDSDEYMKVEYITYLDFQNLDIQDVDWSALYFS